MKKILIIPIVLLAFIACKKDPETDIPQKSNEKRVFEMLTGKWQLTACYDTRIFGSGADETPLKTGDTTNSRYILLDLDYPLYTMEFMPDTTGRYGIAGLTVEKGILYQYVIPTIIDKYKHEDDFIIRRLSRFLIPVINPNNYCEDKFWLSAKEDDSHYRETDLHVASFSDNELCVYMAIYGLGCYGNTIGNITYHIAYYKRIK